MTSSSRRTEVIRAGRWTREGNSGHVWIVRQNWDYYHEAFFDEGPDLGEDGFAYYALYGVEPELSEHMTRSPTCLSEGEAVERANALVGNIEWLDIESSRL